MDKELVIRIAAYIPLILITAQVVWLSRILTTRAWTLLAIGFTVFALLSGMAFFITLPISLRLAGAFLGYLCISVGLHVFRRDLVKVLTMPKKVVAAKKP